MQRSNPNQKAKAAQQDPKSSPGDREGEVANNSVSMKSSNKGRKHHGRVGHVGDRVVAAPPNVTRGVVGGTSLPDVEDEEAGMKTHTTPQTRGANLNDIQGTMAGFNKSQAMKTQVGRDDALFGQPDQFEQYTELGRSQRGSRGQQAMVDKVGILNDAEIQPHKREITPREALMVSQTWN